MQRRNSFLPYYSFAIIFISTLFVSVNSVTLNKKNVVSVIDQQLEYTALEQSLWEFLDKPSEKSEHAQVKKIFETHRTFVNKHENKDFDVSKYGVLTNHYEWNTLETDLAELNGLFKFYHSLINRYLNNDYNREAILEFSEEVFSDNSVKKTLQKIENVMVKQALYYRAMMEGQEHLCATGQSAQQFTYSLYADIALTELKGFMMMQFSWMMLRAYNKGNFTEESMAMTKEYEKRNENTLKLLRQVMKRADRIVWKCDPTVFKKGENYDEVTRLLQGFVENEVDMNGEGTCKETCDFYEVADNHGCFKQKFCARQPSCSGKILNCQYLDSDMQICQSNFGGNRRYEYIEYENGRVLGRKDKCHRGITSVDSWWRYLFWHCSYCFCICDEKGSKSDRYFNLRETISNIDENMVITGIRFIKQKRIFHLQVQQGKLLPRGVINATTLQWKAIEDYNIYDRDVKDGKDYFTMESNKRIVDLDDVYGDDPTHVVTGVKFRLIGSHLNLEVRLSEYKFESGELISPKSTSFWKSNDNTDVAGERRNPINLRNPDIPINSPAKSLPTSKHNQYIQFTHTDMDKDAAQTTVPFIDIQEVVSNPPVPLSGLGIYHKGRMGYGGFLAPKLITYDFTPHIDLPPKNY